MVDLKSFTRCFSKRTISFLITFDMASKSSWYFSSLFSNCKSQLFEHSRARHRASTETTNVSVDHNKLRKPNISLKTKCQIALLSTVANCFRPVLAGFFCALQPSHCNLDSPLWFQQRHQESCPSFAAVLIWLFVRASSSGLAPFLSTFWILSLFARTPPATRAAKKRFSAYRMISTIPKKGQTTAVLVDTLTAPMRAM